MKYAVFGPREVQKKRYDDYRHVMACLDDLLTNDDFLLLCGGHGFDKLAERYCLENGIDHRVVPPSLKSHGQDAFVNRDLQMIFECDRGIVFWDGTFHGGGQVIASLTCAKKRTIVFPVA